MDSNVHNQMALTAYQNILDIPSDQQKEFRSLARSFPSMLQTNGLCAAIAFLNAKMSFAAHKKLYQILTDWLRSKYQIPPNQDLLNWILELDNSSYRLCTDEAMNFCLWIKRFAEGMSSQNDDQPKRPEQEPGEQQQ